MSCLEFEWFDVYYECDVIIQKIPEVKDMIEHMYVVNVIP